MEIKKETAEELIRALNATVEVFKRTHQQDIEYRLCLANGENISVKTSINNLPHLLGLNTEYLKAKGFTDKISQIDILRELSSNTYRLYQRVRNGDMSYDSLFSDYILNKQKYALENIKIDSRRVLLICKFDPNRSYSQGKNDLKCDYIVISKLSDNKIGVLTLVKNDRGYGFSPKSNQIYDSLEDTYVFLENQPITTLSQLQVFDNYFRNNEVHGVNIKAKRELLALAREVAQQSNSIVDVSGELDYRLRMVSRTTTVTDCLKSIASSYQKGITVDPSDMPVELSDIVKTLNNILIQPPEHVNKSYSAIADELSSAKAEILRLQAQVELLDSEKERALEEREQAWSEAQESNIRLAEAEERLQKVYQIVKPSI